MATMLNYPATERSVHGCSGKLHDDGPLDATPLNKGLREEHLLRYVSNWSVSTRSNSSSDDLNKFESDDEKRHCPSTDDGACDSDALSEDAASSLAWETASEGTSCCEEVPETLDICPVTSLLDKPQATGVGDDSPGRRRPLPRCRSDSNVAVARSVRAILNKLTLEKFQLLYEQLTSGIRTQDHVQILLEEVFDKALVQHPFLPMYADLCARLAADVRTQDGFEHSLMEMCRTCFAQLFVEEEDAGNYDPEEARIRRKHRCLGTVKWIGELLTRGLLRSRLLCTCVQQLLKERQRCPEFVEFAAALLRSAGKTFDVSTWDQRPQLLELFAEIEELSTSGSLPLRLRFLLRDLLELRAAGWQSARPPPKPCEEARTSGARPQSTRQLPTTSASTSLAPRDKASGFDQVAFRRLLAGTLRDLRADRDAKKALGRLKAAAVPRRLQATEFSDMITRVAEDASGPARRASFAVLLGLSLGKDSAFHPEECVRGTAIFFREVYQDLCDQVPRLSVVMSTELLPLLRKSWASVDFGSFLPKELQ
ncbi:unnamed protein product [Symbiodinium pilosum]|uniref:MIF4G domain-containing protein n=1 Tax=Symbiodinium pilosum TaxID=2952 RepID=A0A812TW43_SYMPI|nr:unnamed protein product [Symbiodinium pilosum]